MSAFVKYPASIGQWLAGSSLVSEWPTSDVLGGSQIDHDSSFDLLFSHYPTSSFHPLQGDFFSTRGWMKRIIAIFAR